MRQVICKDLRLIEYGKCRAEQEVAFNALLADKSNGTESADETLILCEHPNVYTIGRSGKDSNVLVSEEFLRRIDAQVYHIDRGGDVTYHGPGQLVGYPILDLERHGIGVREYIRLLEQIIIETVAEFGIEAGRMEGAAGVWLRGEGRQARKICAIGVRCSRYVTMHGFALNVNTDLGYFSHINPCGFTDRGVTSLERELSAKVSMEQVKRVLCDRFERDMNVKIKIEMLCQLQKDGF